MYAIVSGCTTTNNEAHKPLAKIKNLSRYGFDEETKLMVLDWLVASYGGEAQALICEAVQQHIKGRLEREPEMLKRFETARKRRTGATKPKIVPVATDRDA